MICRVGKPAVAQLLDPGFSTADADYPEIHLRKGDLMIRFQDWQEEIVEVWFIDSIANQWQEAQVYLEDERDDSCYEILHSCWLFDHRKQGIIDSSEDYKHYRFNFNTCGQLAVIARSYRLVNPPLEINLSNVMTSVDLHLELANAFGFPDFYGQNWDAFWDAITGLVEMPQILRFIGWTGFNDRLPQDALKLRQCLEDFQREHPDWRTQIEYC
jgi:RNAse (barnase) inhibitor barstar